MRKAKVYQYIGIMGWRFWRVDMYENDTYFWHYIRRDWKKALKVADAWVNGKGPGE